MGKRLLNQKFNGTKNSLRFPKRDLGTFREHLKAFKFFGNVWDPQQEAETKRKLGIKVDQSEQDDSRDETRNEGVNILEMYET